MRVKTYRTRSIQEAVEQIKRDFGSEAVILGTRPVSNRRPWGLKRQLWEVTAGVEESASREQVVKEQPAAGPVDDLASQTNALTGGPAGRGDASPKRSEPPAVPDMAAGPVLSEFEAPSRLIRKTEARIEEVLEEIDELKRSIRLLGRALPQHEQAGGTEVYAELVGQGLESDFVNNLIASASRLEAAPGKLRDAVRALLSEMFAIEPPVELESKQRTISVFVGPTGVGKTTTIAKLAGQAAARYGRKVALITTDAQRVAGQEQLTRYGQLLGIQVFKCAEIQGLRSMIQSLEDYSLILVDTAGCSPSDLARLGRLREALDGLGARVHLVLSATTKTEDVSKIYKRFHRFAPQSVVVSKMDETDTQGAMVAELLRYLLPVSYISDGQQVPENLLLPNGAGLARLVLPVRWEKNARTVRKDLHWSPRREVESREMAAQVNA